MNFSKAIIALLASAGAVEIDMQLSPLFIAYRNAIESLPSETDVNPTSVQPISGIGTIFENLPQG